MVTEGKRFDCVKVLFSVRGHSYLECDKDVGLINQKIFDWRDVIENSKKNPSPYKVIDCKNELLKAWSDFLKPMY